MLGTAENTPAPRYLLVVRPAQMAIIPDGLYLTPTGMLLGIRDGNRCIMAWNIANRRFYAVKNDIRHLSLFLFVDEKSSLNSADEAHVLREIAYRILPQANRVPTDGLPTVKALTEAMSHPNPAVQMSATRILFAGETVGIFKP
ncbi:MAG: hypothetical protein ABSH20_13525 [Tepidisphaeraceae bacterium]